MLAQARRNSPLLMAEFGLVRFAQVTLNVAKTTVPRSRSTSLAEDDPYSEPRRRKARSFSMELVRLNVLSYGPAIIYAPEAVGARHGIFFDLS